MNFFIDESPTTPKMKIALRSSDRFCGTAEQAWKILPNGLREFIMLGGDGERANQLHDLRDVFTIFVPRCRDHILEDAAYDWNIPCSIDAAFVVAGDLYLEGKLHQSVQMIFFAAFLSELISDFGTIKLLYDSISDGKTYRKGLWDYLTINCFKHIRHAAVNTRTTKLLRDYLGNVYPSEKIWRRKLCGSVIPSTANHELFNCSLDVLGRELGRKLVTIFCVVGPDNYREVQIYEDSTLLDLFKVCLIHCVENFNWDVTSTRDFLLRPVESIKKVGYYVVVNDTTEFHLFTSASRSIVELGINEGDTIARGKKDFYDGVSEVGAGGSISHKPNDQAPRKTKKMNAKKKRKPKKASNPLTAHQPTNQQIKEAHSNKMESVLNELRPQLQPIRRKLDSLTLQCQLPKQKKGVKVISHDDKENIGNFANSLGAKAGKTVYPILVGLESNLYSSSKVSRSRKAISLDLHGLSNKQALKTLQESLPQWVDTAMKGEHPWVIPVNVICGGGSQELSEVVSAWIRRESQVANRPKSLM